jgi:predicted TIM-barrel fold metal-dependent hydrolase
MMRLIIAGAFDAFPRLKIILGHYAEALPFMLDGVDRPYRQGHVRPDPSVAPVLRRTPSNYLRGHMLSSTSGTHSDAAFVCIATTLGTKRMVIGTDHPFEDMSVAMAFLHQFPMTEAQREDLYWRTAAGLGMG